MAIYALTKTSIERLEGTELSAEGISERGDLQRLLRTDIGVLGPDLMVISEEFSQWQDSTRRIDLLCIDKEANIVVVELKRTEDGGHMELQAIRYAAMVSSMKFTHMVEAHRTHLDRLGQPSDAAEQQLLSFLQWESPQEDAFANEVRIILASADFSKELTTSVLWLNDQGLDITCVRLKPYRLSDGKLLLDVQQLIPLPESAEYQTQMKAKAQEGKSERYEYRFRFWSALLKLAKTKTDLHAGRTPGRYSYIGGSSGRRGFELNYAIREDESQVELYIDLKDGDLNLKALRQLEAHKVEIERTFDAALEWQDLPESRACRIRKVFKGGYRSPETEWPALQEILVNAMIKLDQALRPLIQKLTL